MGAVMVALTALVLQGCGGSGAGGVAADGAGDGSARLSAVGGGSRIVFEAAVKFVNQIFTVNSDGSGLVQLTNAQTNSRYAAWSPGQGYIAFVRQPSIGGPIYGPIYVMQATGEANGGRIFQATSGMDFAPDWSPNGTSIAFQRSGDIYVVTVDVAAGTAGSPTPRIAGPTDEGAPAWSPDGNRMAFQRFDSSGNSAIFIRDLTTGGETGPIAAGPGTNGAPSWSPDGSRISFQASVGASMEIYTVNADGTSLSKVTNLPNSDEMFPTWSPDGTALALRSNQNRKAGIYRLELATGVFTLLSGKVQGNNPEWSP